MNIRILGARGEIPLSKPFYQKHSGVLINGKLLCDLGEKEYLKYSPQLILITHLHPDHAFFIRDREEYNIKSIVLAPENSKNFKFITVCSAPVMIDDYKITPIPTQHSAKVKSQGYLIEKEGKRIFYSGDLVDISPDQYSLLENLDAVITEASFIRKGGLVRKTAWGVKYGHTGVPDLISLFSKFTHHIIFTHFGSWFLKDPVKGRIKIESMAPEGMKVDIGYEGREFEV